MCLIKLLHFSSHPFVQVLSSIYLEKRQRSYETKPPLGGADEATGACYS